MSGRCVGALKEALFWKQQQRRSLPVWVYAAVVQGAAAWSGVAVESGDVAAAVGPGVAADSGDAAASAGDVSGAVGEDLAGAAVGTAGHCGSSGLGEGTFDAPRKGEGEAVGLLGVPGGCEGTSAAPGEGEKSLWFCW